MRKALLVAAGAAALLGGGCGAQEQARTVTVERTVESEEALPEGSATTGETMVSPEETQATPTQAEPTQPEATEQAESGEENFLLSVGETAEIGGLELTLTEAFLTEGTDFDQDYYELGPEEKFLVARFDLVNDRDSSLELLGSGSEFFVYNQQGYELEYASLDAYIESSTPREDQELYGDYRPGSDVTGTVAFLAQTSDDLLVEFNPDGYLGGDPLASWEIGQASELSEQPFPSGATGDQYGS